MCVCEREREYKLIKYPAVGLRRRGKEGCSRFIGRREKPAEGG